MNTLSIAKIHKAGRIDQVVRDFFANHSDVDEVPALELMPLLIEKGIFATPGVRPGKAIRDVLRDLDAAGQLSLIKHVRADRKSVNTNWYFERHLSGKK